jgi:hypothetical protein
LVQQSSPLHEKPPREDAPPHRRAPEKCGRHVRAARPSLLACRTSPPERQLELAQRGSPPGREGAGAQGREALGRAGGDVRDLGASRRGQRVELESSTRLVTDVHAVQGEHMKVHVQSERTVRPLYCRDGAGVRVRHSAERESCLRPATERARELPNERAHDLRAEPPIVAEERAKAPG